ncbi:MAG: hypothetical protein M3020_27435 [Myxococcota bacterium]|nr:hypothetical protein [Myxococcota bacterium]
MKFKSSSMVLAAAGVLSVVANTSLANAEPSRRAEATRTDRVETTGPNRKLLSSGAWTLGLSYAPALVVAIKSERRGDDYLYYPVVGPWLDLAHRKCATCGDDNLNQALLVTDGVFQGIGALSILGAFLLPERHTTTTVSRAKAEKKEANSGLDLKLKPVRLSGGYGLQATARF